MEGKRDPSCIIVFILYGFLRCVCIKIWPGKQRKEPSAREEGEKHLYFEEEEKRIWSGSQDAAYIKPGSSLLFSFLLLCNPHHLPTNSWRGFSFSLRPMTKSKLMDSSRSAAAQRESLIECVNWVTLIMLCPFSIVVFFFQILDLVPNVAIICTCWNKFSFFLFRRRRKKLYFRSIFFYVIESSHISVSLEISQG